MHDERVQRREIAFGAPMVEGFHEPADQVGVTSVVHSGDVRTALRAWKAAAPCITRYQEAGLDQRSLSHTRRLTSDVRHGVT
jgi:hypothetical protein